MDALQLAQFIYDNPWVRFILGLIGANVLLGLATALFSSRYQFYLGELGTFLLNRVLPYLLCWGAVKLVAVTALADYAVAAQATELAVSAVVILSLLGHISENLRVLGLPVPEWAGNKPKPDVTAGV